MDFFVAALHYSLSSVVEILKRNGERVSLTYNRVSDCESRKKSYNVSAWIERWKSEKASCSNLLFSICMGDLLHRTFSCNSSSWYLVSSEELLDGASVLNPSYSPFKVKSATAKCWSSFDIIFSNAACKTAKRRGSTFCTESARFTKEDILSSTSKKHFKLLFATAY